MEEIKENFNIDKFPYANLKKCEWFLYKNKLITIYFTDNVSHPAYCIETWCSFLLRKFKVKKDISFGKPKKIPIINPQPPPNFSEQKQIENYRIRFSEKKEEK